MSRKPIPKGPVINEQAVNELFTSIADEDDRDTASMDGIAKLSEMLQIDPSSDIRILVLLWKFGAKKPGQISRSEFLEGFTKLGLADLKALKAYVPALDPGFLERTEFRELYKFVFQFNREGTQKTLEKDMVMALMPMIIDAGRAPHLQHFLDYLQQCKHTRITLDQWESFLQFNNNVNVDLSNFEDDGAWPLMLDEYVEWRRKV